jgi:hypothetical protein
VPSANGWRHSPRMPPGRIASLSPAAVSSRPAAGRSLR